VQGTGREGDDTPVIDENLSDGTSRLLQGMTYKRGVSGKVGRVKGRHAAIVVPGPEELLVRIEGHGRDERRHAMAPVGR
jgi:hypothetical protein